MELTILVILLYLMQLELLAKTIYTLAQQMSDTAGIVVRELPISW